MEEVGTTQESVTTNCDRRDLNDPHQAEHKDSWKLEDNPKIFIGLSATRHDESHSNKEREKKRVQEKDGAAAWLNVTNTLWFDWRLHISLYMWKKG